MQCCTPQPVLAKEKEEGGSRSSSHSNGSTEEDGVRHAKDRPHVRERRAARKDHMGTAPGLDERITRRISAFTDETDPERRRYITLHNNSNS